MRSDKGIFSGMMIASDIDGTIKPSGKPIPERNMQAIRYFEENGGLFTLATGRSIAATRPAMRETGLDCPVIVNNGATVYDYKNEEILWEIDLHESAYETVGRLMEKFENCGIEVYSGRRIEILRRTEMTDERLKRFGIDSDIYSFCTLEESKKPWQKALAVADEKTANEIDAYFKTLKSDELLFMKTSPYYCELVPVNGTKADGVKNLAQLFNIRTDRIFTAGDHNNDIHLLKAGYRSFAPSGALEEVKDVADFTVCSCEDGVIADIVDHICKNCI